VILDPPPVWGVLDNGVDGIPAIAALEGFLRTRLPNMTQVHLERSSGSAPSLSQRPATRFRVMYSESQYLWRKHLGNYQHATYKKGVPCSPGSFGVILPQRISGALYGIVPPLNQLRTNPRFTHRMRFMVEGETKIHGCRGCA
jgi:hypothetical protein